MQRQAPRDKSSGPKRKRLIVAIYPQTAAASTGRRNTLAQTEESEFVLTSQRHSPWFTLHEKPGPWNHCQPSSNGNVKRLLWLDPSRKSGGALHRLHCFCLEFDGACEVQRRVPTDWIIEPVDVSGYGSFSLAS